MSQATLQSERSKAESTGHSTGEWTGRSLTDGLEEALQNVRGSIQRNAQRARNGYRLSTGRLPSPPKGVTPHDVVWTSGRARLLHYRNDNVRYSTPLLLVYSLANRSYVYDLAPGNSFVERLRDEGVDVYLLDWGVPDERDASNTLHTYAVEGIGGAIKAVQRDSGHHEVNLYGYCLGGLLAMLGCSARPDWPVRSLMTAAVPLDMSKMGAGTNRLFRERKVQVDDILDDTGNMPGPMVAQWFSTLSPFNQVNEYVNLFDGLWNEQYLHAYQLMTGWGKDHIPIAGATMREVEEKLLLSDTLVTEGTLEIGGREVSLSDITVPFRSFVADNDTIVPAEASADAVKLVGSEDSVEVRVPGGHVGLMVGRSAHKRSVPRLIEFIKQSSEEIDARGSVGRPGTTSATAA
jgi:polyhydroxyalkanoate synthase subunit PhaC